VELAVQQSWSKSVPYPSIFNDVIGPVMRGPSSSHCAAALRIGRIARDLMGGEIESVHIQFDPAGSLATTHASQGSDMGLFGGLLGWEATDERLPRSARLLDQMGILVEIEITPFEAPHPNTYRMRLSNPDREHELVAVSTGGGMIEVVAIDGIALSMAGDYHETLIGVSGEPAPVVSFLEQRATADDILTHGDRWVEVKSQAALPAELLMEIESRFMPGSIRAMNPVLPVLSRRGMTVPFLTARDMLQAAGGDSIPLSELAIRYEAQRGGLPREELLGRMSSIVETLDTAVARGLAGTVYEDRILGRQSDAMQRAMSRNKVLDGGMLNLMTLYVTALMEMKSSMGVIVAAPTAGSCGGLPGAVLGAADTLGCSVAERAHALLAAGMIGIFIAAHATFAAEVGGCQAECGAGSGMAAAALVTLAGGSAQQAVAAASMALQNTLGMICDPVANRVEVPCLGKNVMAAANALACANMALAGYDPVIPLDEVIETMDRVGKSLPMELRCTALGGLSVTRTSKSIEQRLKTAPTA
jgi:L-serine dehydratase